MSSLARSNRAVSASVIVHMPGKSSLSGTFKGKAEFADMFQRFTERSPEYSFESHAYSLTTNMVCCSSARTTSAATSRFDTNDTFVCHFRDGKVMEMWLATDDPYGVDAFLG